MKTCSQCHIPKDEGDFYPRRANCKVCHNLRSNSHYSSEKNHAQNLKRYGLSVQEYDQMLEDQGRVCAICRMGQSRGHSLAVDHDHSTGNVRGLLCHRCNRVLGVVKDNPELLATMIEYLRHWC